MNTCNSELNLERRKIGVAAGGWGRGWGEEREPLQPDGERRNKVQGPWLPAQGPGRAWGMHSLPLEYRLCHLSSLVPQ